MSVTVPKRDDDLRNSCLGSGEVYSPKYKIF